MFSNKCSGGFYPGVSASQSSHESSLSVSSHLIFTCYVHITSLKYQWDMLTLELSSNVLEIQNDAYTTLSLNLIGCSTLFWQIMGRQLWTLTRPIVTYSVFTPLITWILCFFTIYKPNHQNLKKICTPIFLSVIWASNFTMVLIILQPALNAEKGELPQQQWPNQ